MRGGHRVGAGRPGREVKVEDCLRLSVAVLKRQGVLGNFWTGQWTWPSTRVDKVQSVVQMTNHDRCCPAVVYQSRTVCPAGLAVSLCAEYLWWRAHLREAIPSMGECSVILSSRLTTSALTISCLRGQKQLNTS